MAKKRKKSSRVSNFTRRVARKARRIGSRRFGKGPVGFGSISLRNAFSLKTIIPAAAGVAGLTLVAKFFKDFAWFKETTGWMRVLAKFGVGFALAFAAAKAVGPRVAFGALLVMWGSALNEALTLTRGGAIAGLEGTGVTDDGEDSVQLDALPPGSMVRDAEGRLLAIAA